MQLQAVEKAPTAAKRAPIRDHIDHCLGTDGETDLAETKAPAKPLRSAPPRVPPNRGVRRETSRYRPRTQATVPSDRVSENRQQANVCKVRKAGLRESYRQTAEPAENSGPRAVKVRTTRCRSHDARAGGRRVSGTSGLCRGCDALPAFPAKDTGTAQLCSRKGSAAEDCWICRFTRPRNRRSPLGRTDGAFGSRHTE